ncbi:MAG TPA: DUF1993 domain-containing protein, partial [Polyangiaceae bacterium]|nr:DUF1993 domain-containing protein [Polyangiaceae bacterium]
MSVSLYELATGTFVPMLRSLSGLLDKGARHASDRQLDPGGLVGARLAPDMFPLAKQVQFACTSACYAVDRLAGRASPAFENDEASFDDLKARIAKTIEHLQGS